MTASTPRLFPSSAAGMFGRRQRRPRGPRIPVTVVTGFLGAGKTTLVRRFLTTPDGHGTAVIINEFGAIGIDDKLVRASAETTTLLGNGCVCCTTRSDLEIALRRLVSERERGAVPFFGRVVIETSGLADPGPILQTFITDRALGGEFHVDVVIAVVDAVTGVTHLGTSPEARRQAILADRFVITKSDLAGTEAVEHLKNQLKALNPRADTHVAIDGQLNPRGMIEPPIIPAGEDSNVRSSAFFAEIAHQDRINSFVMTLPEPLVWPAFARAMETLGALRGSDLLRAKGLLNVEGCRGPVVVQFVQHLAHPPVELDAWPDTDHTSRLVFITRGIQEQDIRQLFDAVAALLPESRDPPAAD